MDSQSQHMRFNDETHYYVLLLHDFRSPGHTIDSSSALWVLVLLTKCNINADLICCPDLKGLLHFVLIDASPEGNLYCLSSCIAHQLSTGSISAHTNVSQCFSLCSVDGFSVDLTGWIPLVISRLLQRACFMRYESDTFRLDRIQQFGLQQMLFFMNVSR